MSRANYLLMIGCGKRAAPIALKDHANKNGAEPARLGISPQTQCSILVAAALAVASIAYLATHLPGCTDRDVTGTNHVRPPICGPRISDNTSRNQKDH